MDAVNSVEQSLRQLTQLYNAAMGGRMYDAESESDGASAIVCMIVERKDHIFHSRLR